MSLSRILNDEPLSAPSSYVPNRGIHVDSPATSSRLSPPKSHPQHHHSAEPPHPPQAYPQKGFQPPAAYPFPPDWPSNEPRATDNDKRRKDDDMEYSAPTQRRVSGLSAMLLCAHVDVQVSVLQIGVERANWLR
jgi:hypothetical protein